MQNISPFNTLLRKSKLCLTTKIQQRNDNLQVQIPTRNIKISKKPQQNEHNKIANKKIQYKRQGNQKIFILLVRRLINNHIIQSFKRIKYNLQIKHFSLDLLITKHKRNLKDAFYLLKLFYQTNQIQKLQKKLNPITNSSFLFYVLKRINLNTSKSAFINIKLKSKRKLRIIKFIQILDQSYNNFLKQSYKIKFISRLQHFNSKQKFMLSQLRLIIKFTKKHQYRLLRQSLITIVNFIVYSQYEQKLIQSQYLSNKVIELNIQNKQKIKQKKQVTKKLQLQLSQLKLQKNRVIYQQKKQKTLLKQQQTLNLNQLQTQLHIQTQQQTQYKQILKQQKRKLSLRQANQLNSFGSIQKVMNIYQHLIMFQKQQIQISHDIVINQLLAGDDLVKFQTLSSEYYFYHNLQLINLICHYQNVAINPIYHPQNVTIKTNIQQQYLSKVQLNQSLKNIVSLLINRQIQKYVEGKILKFTQEITDNLTFSPVKSIRSSKMLQSQAKTHIFSSRQFIQ